MHLGGFEVEAIKRKRTLNRTPRSGLLQVWLRTKQALLQNPQKGLA